MVLSAVAVGFPSEAQYVTVQRQARRVLSVVPRITGFLKSASRRM